MRSAEDGGRDPRRIADVQRADSGRRAKLVTAERHQIASERRNIDRNSADRLRRIDMKQRAVAGARRCERREILNRSDFRVRKSERDERGFAIERHEHARRIDSTVGVGRDAHDLKAATLEFRKRSEDR